MPDENAPAKSITVELWYAPLPRPLSWFAWHHWFVVRHGETIDRWEVWQSQSAGGESTGHIHKNLMRPESGVGGGASVRLFRWQGMEAENIVRILEHAWTNYPHRLRYLAFPGPNSNTFVAWVLKRAGLAGDAALLLGRQAIGRGWRSLP